MAKHWNAEPARILRNGAAAGSNETNANFNRWIFNLPAPYAGTNRIRFNGFAGRFPHLRPKFGPPQGRRSVAVFRVTCKDARMEIFQVDAFTKKRFTGNPATVILGADDEPDTTLAAIAREFPHAETAFVLPPDAADHDLRMRYFSARKEAAFVGHATVAAHAVLLASNLRPPGTLRQKSGTGVMDVTATGAGSNTECFVEFRQTAPVFDPDMPIVTATRVAQALGLTRESLDERLPVRIARRGSARVLIALPGEHLLNRLEPRFDELLKIGKELGIEGFFAFYAVRDDRGLRTHSRMFCPALGIQEDPVSGNAHAMLAAYLWDRGILNSLDRCFIGFQGDQMRRPGCVQVTLELERERMIAARIGGNAVIVSAGALS